MNIAKYNHTSDIDNMVLAKQNFKSTDGPTRSYYFPKHAKILLHLTEKGTIQVIYRYSTPLHNNTQSKCMIIMK